MNCCNTNWTRGLYDQIHIDHPSPVPTQITTNNQYYIDPNTFTTFKIFTYSNHQSLYQVPITSHSTKQTTMQLLTGRTVFQLMKPLWYSGQYHPNIKRYFVEYADSPNYSQNL